MSTKAIHAIHYDTATCGRCRALWMPRHAPPPSSTLGRLDVSKSTLFNRLAGRRIAIVDEMPGVTRDRREASESTAAAGPETIPTA